MASQIYELASAYVRVMPSLQGLQQELTRQLSASQSTINRMTQQVFTSSARAMGQTFSSTISNTMRASFTTLNQQISAVNVAQPINTQLQSAGSRFGTTLRSSVSGSLSSIGSQLSSSIGGALRSSVGAFGNALTGAARGAGNAFKDTAITGAKMAAAALTTAVGAVGAQAVGGGFQRALGLNEAVSKLEALGYTATEVQGVMGNVMASIDGTSYTTADAVGTAGQLLAAGIPQGQKLEGILKSTSKLADLSGSSFKEMGAIMAKNAASGIVQWEDMVQLIDRGVPIQSYLAKNIGVTTAELKKMASAGEITFDMFAEAVNQIDFDSALYASKNVSLAFKNVRSQVSKIGGTLWEPIINGLGPILIKVREGLIALQKNEGFQLWINSVRASFGKAMESVEGFVDKLVQGIQNIGKGGNAFTGIIESVKNLATIFKGAEGPIAGLGLAMSSKLLSNIPIIGGLLGGLSITAGVLGGTFIGAYKNSDALQDSVGRLGSAFKVLFKNLTSGGGFNAGGILQTIGDSLSKVTDAVGNALRNISLGDGFSIDFSGIFDGIATNIAGFINKLTENSGEIVKAITDVFKTVGDALKGFSGGNKLGETAANTLTNAIKVISLALQAVIPVFSAVIGTLVNIVTSDGFSGFINWLAGIAKSIAENEALITGMAVALGAWFIGGKLLGPIMALVRFAAPVSAAASGGLVVSMNAIMAGIVSAAKIFVKGAGYILGAIAVAGAAIALMGIIGNIFTALDTNSGLQEFANSFLIIFQTLASGLNMVIVAIQPLLDWLGGVFLSTLQVVAGVAVAVISSILANLSGIVDSFFQGVSVVIEAIGGFATTLFQGVEGIIKTLASDGMAAAGAAWALASGIGAMMLALGGGAVAGSIGTAIGGVINGITGQESITDQLMSLITGLTEATAIVNNMPNDWYALAEGALRFGLDIPRGIALGIETDAYKMTDALNVAVNSMLDSAQATLDSRTLQVRTAIDNPNLSGIQTGVAGGITQNTKNNNFNITTQNDALAQMLVRSAR